MFFLGGWGLMAGCPAKTVVGETLIWISLLTSLTPSLTLFLVALSLAMNRDGSSGGVAYIVTIDEHSTEEKVVLGNNLPTFFDQ